MAQSYSRLFVFGLGYTSLRFIELFGERFSNIAGTVRTSEKAASLAGRGIEVVPFDTAGVARKAADSEAMFVSVPPAQEGDIVLNTYGQVLGKSGHLRWVGYLSTTGVYGNREGAWTDETTPINPSTDQSHRRVAAEQAWLAWGIEHNIPVQIFRLSGIYGPGRSSIDAVRQGTARRIVKPEQVFNRIHVDDIAAVLWASLQHPKAGGIYNVSDDEPAPPQDVVTYAANLLNVSSPQEIPFEKAELSPMARSFYSENKRISNQRIKAELGVRLVYPTYREGLQALSKE